MECTMFKGRFAFHISFLHFLFYHIRKRNKKINGKRERERLLLCGIQKREGKRNVIRNTLKRVVTNSCEVEASNFNNSYIKLSMLFSLVIHISFMLLGWPIKTCGANQNYKAAALHCIYFPVKDSDVFAAFQENSQWQSWEQSLSLCVWGISGYWPQDGIFAVLHLLDWRGQSSAWSQLGKLCEDQSQFLQELHQIRAVNIHAHGTRHYSFSISSYELKFCIILTFLIFWHHILPTLFAHQALGWPLPQPWARVTLWAALPFAASR